MYEQTVLKSIVKAIKPQIDQINLILEFKTLLEVPEMVFFAPITGFEKIHP